MNRDVENRAKFILSNFVSSKYSTMIESESPDWIDPERNYGLEVVIATKEKLIKLQKSLNKKVMSKGEIENLEELGVITSEGFLSHTIINPDSDYFEVIRNVIQLKNSKLKHMYNKFDTNDLFVFAYDPLIDCEDIKMMIPKILAEDISFDHIMVCVDDCLLMYDVNNQELIFEVVLR